MNLVKLKFKFTKNEHIPAYPTKETLSGYTQSLCSKLESNGQARTRETYLATLKSFMKFRKERDIMLYKIDSDILLSYEYYLRGKGLSKNTISFYMRRLRAIYNKAAEEGLITNKFPFKKVYTSTEMTVKRAINMEFIRELKNLDLNKWPAGEFAKDIFLFSFYTRGMSFIDIAYLKKSNLKNGTLTYRRKKTGHKLTIKWEVCMQEILNKYPTSEDSQYLLPIINPDICDDRKQYHNCLTSINRNLNKIGQIIGLKQPLTMYVARHSWASIAKNEGIYISVISEGMGHDSEKTTRIYLASLDSSIIDNANKKILQLLL